MDKDRLREDLRKYKMLSIDPIMPLNSSLTELAELYLSGMVVDVVASICSKHQIADKDCELCKVHPPFAIDTDKYCKSAGYVKSTVINK